MADLKISQLTGASTPLAGTEVVPVVQSGSTKKVSVANLTAGRAVSALSYTADNTGFATPVANFQSGDQSGARVAVINSGAGGQTFHLVAGNPGVGNNGFALYDFTNSATRFYVDPTSGNFTLNTGNLIQGTAGKGVNFTANTPAAGMTSQLRNWYEEGTWTPTLNATGFSGATYATQTGRYTRVGRLVTVSCNVELSALTNGGSNYLRIEGLPFTCGQSGSSGSVYSTNLTGGSSGDYIVGYIVSGQAAINFFEMGPNGSISGNGMQGTRLTATSQFILTATYSV